jgi:hypothetical protein
MSSLHKKIQKIVINNIIYSLKKSKPTLENKLDLFLIFHVNNFTESQRRKLMYDFFLINKAKKFTISCFRLKKEMLLKHETFSPTNLSLDLKIQQELKILLEGPCIVVKICGLFNENEYSFISNILKRLDKEKNFLFLGGLYNKRLYHSDEILLLISSLSSEKIWQNLLSILLYPSQKLTFLLSKKT